MKQLTRNEIIKLIKSPIHDFKYEASSKTIAELVIAALEKAGVLMLVDDEPQEGDIIRYYEKTQILGKKYDGAYPNKEGGLQFWTDDAVSGSIVITEPVEIIQRNNTPVYNCKKEVTDDQQ